MWDSYTESGRKFDWGPAAPSLTLALALSEATMRKLPLYHHSTPIVIRVPFGGWFHRTTSHMTQKWLTY